MVNQLSTNLKTFFLCEEDETIHWTDKIIIVGYLLIVGLVISMCLGIMVSNVWGV